MYIYRFSILHIFKREFELNNKKKITILIK